MSVRFKPVHSAWVPVLATAVMPLKQHGLSYRCHCLVGAGGWQRAMVLFDLGILTLFEATPEKYRPIHRHDREMLDYAGAVQGTHYCRNAKGALVCLGVL